MGAYIKLLEEQGITGIISMQTPSRGQCRLTVESYEKAKLLVLNGFDCKGERVSPRFVSAPTTQIHIHDAPIWISDGVLKAALSPYGKLIGEIRHGKIKLSNGTQTATGVRFATFELKPGSSIPLYLRTTEGSHELRICAHHLRRPGRHVQAMWPARSHRAYLPKPSQCTPPRMPAEKAAALAAQLQSGT